MSSAAPWACRVAALLPRPSHTERFIASRTQELRTPIHGAGRRSVPLAQGVYGHVADQRRLGCTTIGQSASTLLILVDDVLNVTGADADELEVDAGHVDVGELIENVAAIIGRCDIFYTRWLAPMLVTLIANAVKFTSLGSWVEVHVDDDGAFSRIAVADNGRGVAACHPAAFCKPFQQVNAGNERTDGGVGWGVRLVKRRCSLLGATVALP